jgi:hypothetical protein
MGMCVQSVAPAGKPLVGQLPGDCMIRACDGMGGVDDIEDPTDTYSDGKECTDDICMAGTPISVPKTAGAVCATGKCDANANCVQCLGNIDCTGNDICMAGNCVPPSCNNNKVDMGETDMNCGGPNCNPCADGLMCAAGTDCVSGVCTGGTCQAPTCMDAAKNGAESDVDCGGNACSPCPDGKACLLPADCVSQVCVGNLCEIPTCKDLTKNGDETDKDCGGGTCKKCTAGKACLVDADCASGSCNQNVCQ